jgi:hypothetical protein
MTSFIIHNWQTAKTLVEATITSSKDRALNFAGRTWTFAKTPLGVGVFSSDFSVGIMAIAHTLSVSHNILKI